MDTRERSPHDKTLAPGFHPFTNTFNKRNLWMILPDFLIEIWSLPIMEAVANTAGKFIYFDPRSLNWSNKRSSWILAEFDLELGLLDSIKVNIGEHTFRQSIDYWREPF